MLGNHLVPVHSVNDDRPWVEESWWATLLQVQGSLLCAIHWSTDLLRGPASRNGDKDPI